MGGKPEEWGMAEPAGPEASTPGSPLAYRGPGSTVRAARRGAARHRPDPPPRGWAAERVIARGQTPQSNVSRMVSNWIMYSYFSRPGA